MGCHFLTGANRHWPEFLELIGARLAGHPCNEEVGIKVDEPGHPLVAAFGGQDFRITAEIYQFGEPYARDKVRVLLTLDTTKTNVPWINPKCTDFAQAWVKSYGQGRISGENRAIRFFTRIRRISI